MTDEEILQLADEVLAGKARSYVGAAKIFAEYIDRLRTSHEKMLAMDPRAQAMLLGGVFVEVPESVDPATLDPVKWVPGVGLVRDPSDARRSVVDGSPCCSHGIRLTTECKACDLIGERGPGDALLRREASVPLTDAELTEIEAALADVRDNVRGSIWSEENQARYKRRDQLFARHGRAMFNELCNLRRRSEAAPPCRICGHENGEHGRLCPERAGSSAPRSAEAPLQPSTHRHEPVAAEWLERYGLPQTHHPRLVDLLSRVWCSAIDHARWQQSTQRRESAPPDYSKLHTVPAGTFEAMAKETPNACPAVDDGAGPGFMMCPSCGGSGDGPDRIDGPGDVYQGECYECDGKGRVAKAPARSSRAEPRCPVTSETGQQCRRLFGHDDRCEYVDFDKADAK